MAITYPRLLVLSPTRMSECWFDLIDRLSFSPSGNGNIINMSQINEPAWAGTFKTPILERDQRPLWSAWHKSLRGGLRTFMSYDVRHKTPLAYPNAVSADSILPGWNGTCAVSSLGLSGALGLSVLPSGYQFKTGDRVGLEQSGRYGYYEVLEDVTASVGATGAATITVAPFLHTGIFTTAATCRIWRPHCQFIIDQSSWSEMGTVQNEAIMFKGIQKI